MPERDRNSLPINALIEAIEAKGMNTLASCDNGPQNP